MRGNLVLRVQIVSLLAAIMLVACGGGVRIPPHTGIFIERDGTFVELDRASMSFADSSIDPLPTFQISDERPLLIVYTPGESPSDLHMYRIERRPVEEIHINITPKGSEVVHVQPQQELVAGSYVIMHGEGSIFENTPVWGFVVGGVAIEPTEAVPTPTATPTPSLAISVGNVERTPTVEGEYEKEGYDFVVAEVFLRNLGDEPLIVKRVPSVKVIDDRGFEHEAHRGLRLAESPSGWYWSGRLSDIKVIIPPDFTINAQAIVQVPVVSQGLKLVLSGLPGEEEPVTLDLISNPPPEGVPGIPSDVVDPAQVIEIPDIAEVSIQQVDTSVIVVSITNLHGYDIDVRDLVRIQHIDGEGHVRSSAPASILGVSCDYSHPPGIPKLCPFAFAFTGDETLGPPTHDQEAVLVVTVFDPRKETEPHKIVAQETYDVPDSLPFPKIPPWATRPSPTGEIEMVCVSPYYVVSPPCAPFELAVGSGDNISLIISEDPSHEWFRKWIFWIAGLEDETMTDVPAHGGIFQVDFVAPQAGQYSILCASEYEPSKWEFFPHLRPDTCGILYVE